MVKLSEVKGSILNSLLSGKNLSFPINSSPQITHFVKGILFHDLLHKIKDAWDSKLFYDNRFPNLLSNITNFKFNILLTTYFLPALWNYNVNRQTR